MPFSNGEANGGYFNGLGGMCSTNKEEARELLLRIWQKSMDVLFNLTLSSSWLFRCIMSVLVTTDIVCSFCCWEGVMLFLMAGWLT